MGKILAKFTYRDC